MAAARKDKKQVIGEDMTDAQVRAFLVAEPPAAVDRDFHRLERAYRGLRAHDFARFLIFFAAEGGKLDAVDPQGRTIKAVIGAHANGEDYIAALTAAGAR